MIGAAWLAVKGFLGAVPRQVWYALALGFAVWFAYDWSFDRGAGSRDGEVTELRATAAGLQRRLDAAVDANANNQNTIATLEQANAAWAAMARSNEVERDAAVARLDTERARLQGELQAERARRRSIYQGDTNAAQWAATAVPDGIVDRLRAEARARPD
jgi:hypothetical protein